MSGQPEPDRFLSAEVVAVSHTFRHDHEVLENKLLLTVREAADLLRVPVSWLYGCTRTNSVPHVKLGKYLRFDRDELVAWINELRRDGRGPAPIGRSTRPVVRAAQRAEQR